ncbi:hypothetical protein CRG98_028176 [Punica granatum]|uniref:Uncharacterized protein n=1 Tax=Punica granatum TaxID=22663 RepID=A0A2I0J5E6_PUNGR|nr:hypothetical protein CRG98_028176 [Punica granatum]
MGEFEMEKAKAKAKVLKRKMVKHGMKVVVACKKGWYKLRKNLKRSMLRVCKLVILDTMPAFMHCENVDITLAEVDSDIYASDHEIFPQQYLTSWIDLDIARALSLGKAKKFSEFN